MSTSHPRTWITSPGTRLPVPIACDNPRRCCRPSSAPTAVSCSTIWAAASASGSSATGRSCGSPGSRDWIWKALGVNSLLPGIDLTAEGGPWPTERLHNAPPALRLLDLIIGLGRCPRHGRFRFGAGNGVIVVEEADNHLQVVAAQLVGAEWGHLRLILVEAVEIRGAGLANHPG